MWVRYWSHQRWVPIGEGQSCIRNSRRIWQQVQESNRDWGIALEAVVQATTWIS